MNINLIRKEGQLYNILLRDNKILELYRTNETDAATLSFFLFDPEENTLQEICADIVKASFVNIHISYPNCTDIIFASFREQTDETVDIDITAYNLSTKQIRVMCSIRESASVMTGEKRIKIFVLSETKLLVQTEEETQSASGQYMGNLIFTQALYDTETKEAIPIIEENLNNNGIHTIMYLNDMEIMIKTGYSWLEDSRLQQHSEKDALIESVYITTMNQFISDIELKLSNIDMHLLSSAYHDKYILKPEIKDDYVYYDIVDIQAGESECIFYNYVTGEKIIGKNTDIHSEDLHLAYVIHNTPYVRRYIDKSCEFVNLLTAENDISFYDEELLDVCGKLFITKKIHGKHVHMRVYQYPRMDVVLEERCRYIAGINREQDYFFYIDRS